MRQIRNTRLSGFSLIEIMVVLVIGSVLIGGLVMSVNRGRRTYKKQRLKANLETLTQISFFVMGRDIRRAGSNPGGAMGFDVGAPIPLAQASEDRIVILADLDGDKTITSNTEEQITYEFIDSDSDGIKDEIRRQSGNELVISNVKDFALEYQMASGGWETNPLDPALIRKVKLYLKAGTGKFDPDTGEEDTKEVSSVIMLRNFR